jgi:hypothetical protein
MAQKRNVTQEQSVWERRWRERMEAWRASGQTQQEFCQEHGFDACSFSRWKVELARRDQVRSLPTDLAVSPGRSSTSEALPWTEVQWPLATGAGAAETAQAGSGFEIVLPRGWSVRLGPRFETEPLRRLLSVLDERSC